MRTLLRTSLLALVCVAALLFVVPSPGALAQETASPTSDQYDGQSQVPDNGTSDLIGPALSDSLDADDAVDDATTPSSASPSPASPSPASESSATPDGSGESIGPPVTECPPSGVLPDGEKCADATSDLAEDAAEDSRAADDAVDNMDDVDDASAPAASPSPASPSSAGSSSADPSSSSPSSSSPSSSSPSSATGAAPLEDESLTTPASSGDLAGKAAEDSRAADDTVDESPSAQAPSEAQGSGSDDKGVGSGDSSEEAGEAKTGGGEALTGSGTGPRRSISEGDKYPEPVDEKTLTARTLAKDEPEDGGFAALALMGGGSALLAGMVLMGRVLNTPG